MSALTFLHSRGGKIKIGEAAVETMRSFEQHARYATEAGGLLLGRLINDCVDVVVDVVTVPQPGDTRERYGFQRAAGTHQPFIDLAWEATRGTCCLLGDWHTHAEPDPTPSQIDRDNWVRMLREDVRENEACFFVIVGQREIRVWEGVAQTSIVRPCERFAPAPGGERKGST